MCDMKREDKIKKLNELGIYEKWLNNVTDKCPGLSKKEYTESCLNDGSDWYCFISESFNFASTTEGHSFWREISNK